VCVREKDRERLKKRERERGERERGERERERRERERESLLCGNKALVRDLARVCKRERVREKLKRIRERDT
jgi:hypothetical protein